MFAFRSAAVCFQKQRHGSEAVAVFVGKFCAKFEQKSEAFRVQSFARPHHHAQQNARSHLVEASRGLDLTLQARAVEGVL